MATEVRTLFGFGASMMCGLGGDGRGWAQDLERQFHLWNPEVLRLPNIRAASYLLGVQADRATRMVARAPGEMDDRLVGRESGPVASVLSVGHSDAASRLDGRPAFPLDRFVDSLTKLDRLLTDKGQLLYVGLSPCDEEVVRGYGGYPITYTNDRLREFEAAACKIVESEGGVPVPLLDPLMAEGFHQNKLHADGLHPDADGHRRISALVMPEFEAMCRPIS